jgi:hypothetical protein
MRIAVGLLACLGAGALPSAFADPPAEPAPAATAAATVEAATLPPATKPAAPQIDPDEKRIISEGYKPEMRHGVKMFCRREQVLGSRLGEEKRCATLEQLKVSEQESKDLGRRLQQVQKNPQGGG